jgi:methionyl-tRNA formyltransferase
MKVLFVTRTVWYSKIIHNYLLTHFKICDVVKKKNNFNNLQKKYDLIISFGYRFIIPPSILKKSRYSINFHPGLENNPGAGSYSYALFNKNLYYGVTCHFMQKTPDSGNIILQRKFMLLPEENFLSLRQRTIMESIIALYEIVDNFIKKRKLRIKSKKKWKIIARKKKKYFDDILLLKNSSLKNKINIMRVINPEMPGPFIKKRNKFYEIIDKKRICKLAYRKWHAI